MSYQKIVIIDFGGQVYCEVVPFKKITAKMLKNEAPVGIIFTGGPNSVYLDTSPHIEPEVFELGIPILGICYGAQLMAHTLGGKVATAPTSEYGKTETEFDTASLMFADLPEKSVTWMSHTDYIAEVPAQVLR